MAAPLLIEEWSDTYSQVASGYFSGKSYWLATCEWDNQNYPYCTALYAQLSQLGFATGWVPTFAIIGKDNVVYQNDSGFNLGIFKEAMNKAILSFDPEAIVVANPIADQEPIFGTLSTINLSNVFSTQNTNPLQITLENNSNHDVVNASISGSTLTLSTFSGDTIGISYITLKGTAGEMSTNTTFSVNPQYQATNTIMMNDFENETSFPDTWISIDKDNDGYEWYFTDSAAAHSGTNCMQSASDIHLPSGYLFPDNWLITPKVNLGYKAFVSYFECASDKNYPAEHYGVYISTTGTDPSDFTLLFEETTTAKNGSFVAGKYYHRKVSLFDYQGEVYIAFRHTYPEEDPYNRQDLNLDDVFIADSTGTGINNENLIVATKLHQNYPNPFNPNTKIEFELAKNSNIELAVFNVKGEKIVNLVNSCLKKGNHSINFDASSLNSGIYYYTLKTGKKSITQKMILVK